MRIAAAAWMALVPFSLVARAQDLSIADLTACGLTCLIQAIPQSGCGLADYACQCNSTSLPYLSTACLLENCTMHDTFVVAKVQAATCKLPHEDRSSVTMAGTVATISVAAVFVILRLASKAWINSSSLGVDDCIIAIAMLCAIPSTYFTVTMAKQGFGKHAWDLNDGDLSRILKNFFIAENIYVWVLAITKLSLLAFYIRIFPYTWLRWASYATIALIVTSTIISSFMTIFSCQPVPYFWDRDLRGTCLNVNALAYANSGISIIQDLIIVFLPVPILSKLNMGIKKKVGVGLMFALGSFGCIVSMIRLKSLIAYGSSLDPTWDYVDTVLWTTLELGVAIICACLPAIRNLLMRAFPKSLLTSMRTSDAKQSGKRPWHARSKQSSHLDEGPIFELRRTTTEESSKLPAVLAKADSINTTTSEEEWLHDSTKNKPTSRV